MPSNRSTVTGPIWPGAFALALAAFFVLGAFLNGFPSAETAANYERWGYPHWFSRVTGALELLVAVLLMQARTRIAGVALGAAVMLAACGTLIANGEFIHALSPIAVIVALATLSFVTRRARPVRFKGYQP